MRLRKAFTAVIVSVLVLASLVPVVSAAPSGSIYFDPSGQVTSADNVLEVTGAQSTEQFTITFKNTAGADITDVASTIQYITLAAADTNPTRAIINLLAASWQIFLPTAVSRASGTVTGSVDMAAIYSPYSTTDTGYLYTWALGPPSGALDAYADSAQFANDLRILRPGEFLNLTITIQCQGVVGDSRIWFFFRATEAAYASGSYPTSITAIDAQYRVNLYYSKLPGPVQTKYWLLLHNSYDPYDSDIGTGHNFDQNSWTRGSTTTAFAKANKLVHQKPVENPPDAKSCIDIVKDGPGTAQRSQTITYDYTVTNCGTVALSVNKVGGVTDTLGITVSYVSGDTNNDGKLDTTETWLFTSTYTVKEGDPDPLLNSATVTGTPPTGPSVSDTDGHSVDITAQTPPPCIHIVKAGPTTAQVGQTISYDYAVTNCATVALTVSKTGGVTDTLGMTVSYVSGDTNNDGKLDTTETWLFSSTYTVKQSDPKPLQNTATVTGTDPRGDSVSDTDDFSVTIAAEEGVFSFHICGPKFLDLNRDDTYDPASEPGIDGVTVTLLGPDRMTRATAYYTELSYPPPEDKTPDILQTGENLLHGSYCFNLLAGLAASGKTYIFYIEIEGQLIGPITLVASHNGPRESLNNGFGNSPAAAAAVGGLVLQAENVNLLASWTALAGLLGAVIIIAVVRTKRRN